MKQTFSGRLTLQDMATHVGYDFDVGAGTQALRVALSYSPRHPGVGAIPHQLSISVYGPNGARGTRHNNKDQSPVICADWASPGYLAGAIEPGTWTVEIDVHRVLPPGNVDYELTVECADQPPPAPEVADVAPFTDIAPKRRGPGWYKGDLHGHTFHSDGDYSPAEYLSVAHSRGYDFVALTDHNTHTAVAELAQLAGDGITVVGGTELTTFNGHAVVLGLPGWAEWRVKDGTTMSGLASAMQAAGALYIIVHPKSEGHPFCTGCRWAYSDMLPGPARHIEIWNNGWVGRGNNGQAVELFYHWLNTGMRMVATGGTDTHRPMPESFRLPFNMVLAADNTKPDILAAIKIGNCYVSGGPELRFIAAPQDGGSVQMGDMIAPGRVRLHAGWHVPADTPPLEARLVSNGKIITRWDCGDQDDAEHDMKMAAKDWVLLELRDADDDLHALTNPIFAGNETGVWR